MIQFQWTPIYDVRSDLMNEEHREIFKKMEHLNQLNSSQAPKETVLFALDDLIDFTKKHFKDEELYMLSMKYPKAESHAKIHLDLIENLQKYRLEFKNSVYGSLPSSVFDFFQNWLLTHILIVDKAYANTHSKK